LDHFLDQCTHYVIETFFLPAHSSDQTQPLDLGIFNLEKAEGARTKPVKALNRETRQIVKAVNGYQKACCPNNVPSALRRPAVITYWSPHHNALLARIERLSAVNIRHWLPDKRRISVNHSAHSRQATEEMSAEEL
jgi:hypothetical protein